MASWLGAPDRSAVSVRVESNGPVGALIGSLYVHDRPTGTLFDVPLRDSGAARSSTGQLSLAHRWRLRDSRVDHQCRRRRPRSLWPASHTTGRRAGFRPTRAGARRVGDVRSPRVARPAAEGWHGPALPPGTDQGRFIWTMLCSGQSARLVGRAEVTSTQPRRQQLLQLRPVLPGLVRGRGYLAVPANRRRRRECVVHGDPYRQNCYGQQYQMNIWAGSWNVAIPDVASVYTQTYGVGQLSGNSGGETLLAGTGAPNGGSPMWKTASSTRLRMSNQPAQKC